MKFGKQLHYTPRFKLSYVGGDPLSETTKVVLEIILYGSRSQIGEYGKHLETSTSGDMVEVGTVMIALLVLRDTGTDVKMKHLHKDNIRRLM